MKYYIVDAFTDKPFGGNPAGVVLLGNGTAFPSEEFMQRVAAELRYSGTAFVQQNSDSEFTTKYFSPRGEMDLFGDATIAAFGLMRELGIVADGTVCRNHTPAGELEVVAGEQVLMQMAEPKVIVPLLDVEYLHDVMAGSQPIVWPDMPIEVISTGLPVIIMPVGDVESLNAMKTDMDALTELSRELNVLGVHAFAIGNDDYTAHVRNFSPLYGVPEESATGTANAALNCYLHRRNLVKYDEECCFIQGETMRRPSEVVTILKKEGVAYVGGRSAVVTTGELLVD